MNHKEKLEEIKEKHFGRAAKGEGSLVGDRDITYLIDRVEKLTTALESILLESSWPLVKGIAYKALEDGEG